MPFCRPTCLYYRSEWAIVSAASLLQSPEGARRVRPLQLNLLTDNASISREWNSSAYHRLSQPQVSWGKKVLSRLRLRGDEVVLDAGCGTGHLTAELLDLLPRGRVVGVDQSQNMLGSAREHL